MARLCTAHASDRLHPPCTPCAWGVPLHEFHYTVNTDMRACSRDSPDLGQASHDIHIPPTPVIRHKRTPPHSQLSHSSGRAARPGFKNARARAMSWVFTGRGQALPDLHPPPTLPCSIRVGALYNVVCRLCTVHAHMFAACSGQGTHDGEGALLVKH